MSSKIERQTYWVLDGHKPVHCPDHMKWAQWYERADNTVAKDDVDKHHISTVFLGIDHSIWGDPPLLFETLVFDQNNDADESYLRRYATWDEAVAGHKVTVELVEKDLAKAKQEFSERVKNIQFTTPAPLPDSCITFHGIDGKEVGRIFVEDELVKFKGNFDESAQMFVAQVLNKYFKSDRT